MNLSDQICKPPLAEDTPLSPAQAQKMCQETPDWTLANRAITRAFQLKNFREAMAFVNKVADIAEAQQHHPDIFISYKTVQLTLTTHKIGGLSPNDFIMAAKIDPLAADPSRGKAGK